MHQRRDKDYLKRRRRTTFFQGTHARGQLTAQEEIDDSLQFQSGKFSLLRVAFAELILHLFYADYADLGGGSVVFIVSISLLSLLKTIKAYQNKTKRIVAYRFLNVGYVKKTPVSVKH